MKLLFGGDFCPFDGHKVEFDDSIRDKFARADYAFVNLECPLTDVGAPIAKSGPNLMASPNQVKVIGELGASCVTLANNHLLDYGGLAAMQTIKICEDNGIKIVGAGEDLAAARVPLLLERDGERVVIINATEREFSIAGEDSPGANPLDLINVIRDLEVARELSDKIILVIHGGLEEVSYPSPESVRLLRFLAEQKNVIAVIRHHPHVIQGMEMWKGVPIYYSLGNLYFPKDDGDKKWFEGLVVEVEVSDCIIVRHMQIMAKRMGLKTYMVSIATGEESLPSVSLDAINKVWEDEFANIGMNYYYNIFSPYALVMWVLSKLRLRKMFRVECSRRLLIRDYVLCDAHREMLEYALRG